MKKDVFRIYEVLWKRFITHIYPLPPPKKNNATDTLSRNTRNATTTARGHHRM